jgi:hypothetical protein
MNHEVKKKMTNSEILEDFKKSLGISTDYQLAQHFGIDRRKVSAFRNKPSSDNFTHLLLQGYAGMR